ncbi:MAG: PCI domain-containing protein [Candidatus Thorarchaeota archaeon]|jgi:hypothetical protein
MLSKRDGLDPGEEVLFSEGADLLRFAMKGSLGRTREKYSSGVMVVTQKGIVFLESTGMFKTSRKRIHSYTFDEIESISIESRGVSGSISGSAFLSVGYSTPRGVMRVKYRMYEPRAKAALAKVERVRKKLRAPEEIRRHLLQLIKPKGEVSLREIAMISSLKQLMADPQSLTDENMYNFVHHMVSRLIAEGELDGIIDDKDNYVSNVMLARKTVQYQVVIDFTSLYAQLENKGIMLQTIDCPACGGKLDYPENGSTVQCKYCESTVSAVDIFEKFKSLL